MITKITGIYKLEFDSGLYYIGQSVDINKRFATHLSELRAGTHFNHKVQQAFDKEGPPKCIIIAEVPYHDLNDVEAKYIQLTEPHCLNILSGSSSQYIGENAPRAIYMDDDILAVLIEIVENSLVSRKYLSEKYSIDIGTIHDIGAGRGRAVAFKDSHPMLYSQLLKQKAANTRGKVTVVLSNGKETVTLISGEYSNFCRDKGIQNSNLSKVISGDRKSTKGWYLVNKYENI